MTALIPVGPDASELIAADMAAVSTLDAGLTKTDAVGRPRQRGDEIDGGAAGVHCAERRRGGGDVGRPDVDHARRCPTPDGSGLITVGENGHLTIWDVASRRQLSERPMVAVDRNLSDTTVDPSLAVGADRAYTTSFVDGQVVTWPLTPGQWIAIGCQVFARDLTDPERQRFEIEGSGSVCAR